MCPDADVVAPCECTAYFDGTSLLDCSRALSGGHLQELLANASSAVQAYTKLRIRKNYDIWELTDATFGSVSFEEIQIEDTSLRSVSQNALAASKDRLRMINMNKNAISLFPFEEMENFSQLFHLSLYKNHINTVPNIKSSSITVLNLSGNRISSIAPDTLQDLPILQNCYLQDNQIEFIEAGDLIIHMVTTSQKNIFFPAYKNPT